MAAASVKTDVQAELDRLTSGSGVGRVPGIALAILDGDEVHQWVSGGGRHVPGSPAAVPSVCDERPDGRTYLHAGLRSAVRI